MGYNEYTNARGVSAPGRMIQARGGARMTQSISGIYQIRNTINGHRYIGSAVDIQHRWSQHINYLRKGKHHSEHLQRAWDKYGAGAFVFEVIERCDVDQMIAREQHHLDTQQPEYNTAPRAGSSLGVKHTEETRARMSAAAKGKIYTEATIQKLREASSIKHSAERNAINSKAHMGQPAWNKGIPMTDEQKAKMSEIKKGQVPWNKGIKKDAGS